MKYISLFILFLFIVLSCHKDIEEEKIITLPRPVPEIKKQVSSGILGYVYDETGNPVQDASVVLYGQVQKTDKYGIFEFKDIKMDQLGTLISVSKAGFISNFDKIFPQSNINYSYIQLYKQHNNNQFKSEKGGTIDIQGGGKIVFSPNSIAGSDGNLYNGNVIVNAYYLNPKDDNLTDKMPGALIGTGKNGKTAILGTMGMALVDLRDETGKKLNLLQGKTAKLSLPVNFSQSNDAPSEIPLWYFDEETGLWQEEGIAYLQDDTYSGDVSHFSWWNLDAKFIPVYMCVKVVFSNGKPAVAHIVRLTADVIYPTTRGNTDSEGQVCGLVPKGKTMKLEVINPYCPSVLFEKEIGPFDTDITLDDIVLNSTDFLASGKVTCNGNPVQDARIVLNYKLNTKTKTRINTTLEDGSFEFAMPFEDCNIVRYAEVFAYDPVTGDAGSKIELKTDQPNNNIELEICNDCDFSVEIKPTYEVDCNIDFISLEAIANPTGNYSYKWSNGKTTKKIKKVSPGTAHCVTVTETNLGCEVIKCINVYDQKLQILDSLVQHPYCDYNNGIIYKKIVGGIEPYKITVTGPNGYDYQTTNIFLQLNNLVDGEYTITATDAGGCTRTVKNTLIRDKNHVVTIEKDNDIPCEMVVLKAVPEYINTEDLTYKWSDGQTGQSITVYNSGDYCVTISEGVSCEISACKNIEVNPIVSEPEPVSCNNNIYNLYNPFEYELYINGNLVVPYQIIDIDVFDSGYDFYYYYNGAQCGAVEGFWHLPNLENGIKIDSVQNTSCNSCEDGKIFFTFYPDNQKFLCTVGDVYIYAEDDLDTDLKYKNDAGNLPNGGYYVVVRDANTGCFISHEYVQITQSEGCLQGSLKNGIVAFYPFTDGKFDDYSGNNLHLVRKGYGNVIATSDRKNNPNCAISFETIGLEQQWLEYANATFIDTLDDFSISLWYQSFDTIEYYDHILFYKYTDASEGLSLYLDKQCNQAHFTWTDEIKDNDSYFNCQIAIDDHNWHHLVATYDKETNKMQLYRNGILQSSSTNLEINVTKKGDLKIGDGFTGKMDDIILYNRVLSDAEIHKLYIAQSCCD